MQEAVVVEVSLPSRRIVNVVTGAGAAWRGQTDVIVRVIKGVDLDVLWRVGRHWGLIWLTSDPLPSGERTELRPGVIFWVLAARQWFGGWPQSVEMYSLADPKHGLKVGAHHAGPEADPNVPGEPEPELIDRITAWARKTYRLADPDPVASETCMYTTTADETFILERRGRIVVGSPCSGHGFKFAPVTGTRLAALAAEAL